MRISERYTLVPLVESKDYGSAGIDSTAVNLGKVNSFTAVYTFGALTGNSVLKVYAGATAAKTTAIAFGYRLSAADFSSALADQFGDVIAVASTGLTLTATTFDHRLITIEIDPQAMPDGKPFITVEINATATVLLVGAVGIADGRAAGHLIPTILT